MRLAGLKGEPALAELVLPEGLPFPLEGALRADVQPVAGERGTGE